MTVLKLQRSVGDNSHHVASRLSINEIGPEIQRKLMGWFELVTNPPETEDQKDLYREILRRPNLVDSRSLVMWTAPEATESWKIVASPITLFNWFRMDGAEGHDVAFLNSHPIGENLLSDIHDCAQTARPRTARYFGSTRDCGYSIRAAHVPVTVHDNRPRFVISGFEIDLDGRGARTG